MTIKEERQFKLGEPIETFTAYHKETGDELLVDERTFDEEIHSRKPVRVKGGRGSRSEGDE